jgi:hypothetical protein
MLQKVNYIGSKNPKHAKRVPSKFGAKSPWITILLLPLRILEVLLTIVSLIISILLTIIMIKATTLQWTVSFWPIFIIMIIGHTSLFGILLYLICTMQHPRWSPDWILNLTTIITTLHALIVVIETLIILLCDDNLARLNSTIIVISTPIIPTFCLAMLLICCHIINGPEKDSVDEETLLLNEKRWSE